MFRSLQIGGTSSIRNTFFANPNGWRVERRPLFIIKTLIRTLDIPTGDSSHGAFHILNNSQKALGEIPLWMAYFSANYAFNCVSFSEYEDLGLMGAQVDWDLPDEIELRRDQISEDMLRNPRVYSLKPKFILMDKWVVSTKSKEGPLVTERQYRNNMRNVFSKTVEASVYDGFEILPSTVSAPEFGLATRLEQGVVYANGLPGYHKHNHNHCLDVHIGDFVGLYSTPVDKFSPHIGRVRFRNYALIHLLTGFQGIYNDSPKDIKENGYSDIRCRTDEIPEVVLRNPNHYNVWREDSPTTKYCVRFRYNETGADADKGVNTLERIAMYTENERRVEVIPFHKKDDDQVLTRT